MIIKKLKNQKGLTLIHAVIGILLLAMVSSVIFAASMANMQAYSKLKRQQQSYLSVSSALDIFVNSIQGDSFQRVESFEKTVTYETYKEWSLYEWKMVEKQRVKEIAEQYHKVGEPEYPTTSSIIPKNINDTYTINGYVENPKGLANELANIGKSTSGYSDGAQSDFISIYKYLYTKTDADAYLIRKYTIRCMSNDTKPSGFLTVDVDVKYTKKCIYANFKARGTSNVDDQYYLCVEIPIYESKPDMVESNIINTYYTKMKSIYTISIATWDDITISKGAYTW